MLGRTLLGLVTLAALVTEPAAAQCTPLPPGAVAWLRANGDALDAVSGLSGVLQDGATFAPGVVGDAFSLSGTAFVQVAAPALIPSMSGSLTIEAWVLTQSAEARTVVELGSMIGAVGIELLAPGRPCGYFAADCSVESPVALDAGTFHHVAFVVDDDADTSFLYVDGVLVATAAEPDSPTAGATLLVGLSPTAPAQGTFQGLVDELTLYERALSGAEIAAIHDAGSAGKCSDGAWSDEGCALAGVAGAPQLAGDGLLSAGSPNVVALSQAAPGAAAALFVALASAPAPFKGGTLKPLPPLGGALVLATDGSGAITIPFTMPAGVPPGTELWLQWALQDAAAPQGVALSNALRGVTP